MEVVGGNVVLTGDIGAGGVTKLANQIIVAANIEALSEALVLSQKAGVDPEKVFNAIRGGLAGSAVMEAKGLPLGPLAFTGTILLALLLVPPSDRDDESEDSETEE